MYKDRDLLGQLFLQQTLCRVLLVRAGDIGDLGSRKKREDLDPFHVIFITGIQPELIELIGACFFRIQPYVALFRFPEFPTIGFGDQRTGKGIGLTAGLASDQFGARDDIAPLVAATHLEFAFLVLMEPVVVISLHQLVGEFGITESGFALDPFAHTVLGHHVVDRDVLADVTQELEDRERGGPVVIVDEPRRIRGHAEVEELGQLRLDAGDVVLDLGGRRVQGFQGIPIRVTDSLVTETSL